nr:Coenzyme F420 hydrogenase/dehydrogenase, beta subunit C-terminal domain [Candidatus Sigynarchaeota archaeon]
MSNEVYPKNFEDLKKEIHDKGLCGECGGCVSFCSAHDLKAIQMSENGPPTYLNKEKCLKCGICYLVCPQTDVLNEELGSRFEYKEPIGSWRKIASTQATTEDIRQKATDGGTVTSILMFLLDHKLIDGAIVSRQINPFHRVPFYANTKKDLIEAAGSHFTMAGQMDELEHYGSFSPSVTELKSIYKSDIASIAFVGTPCQVHSLRKMQELHIIPSHVVKYALGLFCNMNYVLDDKKCQQIERQFGFSMKDTIKVNMKDDIAFYFKDKPTIHVPFDDMNTYCRSACKICKDFSNYYADISFGGLGSKDGFTTTIVRTKLGSELYDGALKDGYISEVGNLNTPIKKSEMLAKVIGFSEMKKQRASRFSVK